MKRNLTWLMLLACLLGCRHVPAQVSQESVTVTNFVPTGACTVAPLFKVTNVGTYQCIASVWTLIGPEGGGGGAVDSVFGRTGVVAAQTGDYSAAQIGGLGTSATVNTGTSGATIPLLNVANTWSANQTFSNIMASSVLNGASANNASILPLTTGTSISRNVADTNAALTVTQTNASSTGDIADFSNNTGVVAYVAQSGAVVAPFLLSPTSLAIGTMNLNTLVLQTNGTPRWSVAPAPGNLLPATNGGQTIGDSTHNLSNLFTNSFVLTGAQALTSVQGTAGTKIPAASGTFTNGNLRSTNATGDEVDAAVAVTSLAPLASPALTGTPTAPTATTGTNTTQVATTAFVLANASGGSGTVTHTVGALTALHCVIGNGAADVKVDTVCVTDGAGNETLNSLTTGGTQNGALTLGYNAATATVPSTNQFQISPAIAITTPWSYSPAAAPATGLFYGTNNAGVVQGSFKTIIGTDTGVASAATISTTAGTAVCSTANGGVTTTGCSGGSGPANVHTLTTFTGIGTGATTPTHTLDVNGTTDTSVVFKEGTAQSSAPLDVTDNGGTTHYFQVGAFGQMAANAGFTVYSGQTTAGFGLTTIVGDTGGINTSRTAAVGTSGAPITLATAHQFGANNFQSYLLSCYMNTKAASTGVGTVSLFLTWTDDVGVKTSAPYVLTTTTLGTFLPVGPVPIVLNATSSATTAGYYTTITGTPTYGVTCHAEEID